MVKFSFIVPVYNIKQEYLEECINSLINQTLKDFEILIIDDGSTNGASDWCDLLAEQYNDYIRVIHKKNEGVSIARNTGISESNGEYLIFVDPDDWVNLDLCEKLNLILNENNVDILVYSYFRETKSGTKQEKGNNNEVIHKISSEEKLELVQNLIDTNKKCEYKYYNSKIFGACWGKCFKRIFIIENNLFFNEKLVKSQDTVFDLYAFYTANNIIEYNIPLYHYRMVKSSITHRYNKNIIKIQLLYLGEVKKFLSKYGLFDIFGEAFMHICIGAYFNILRLDIFNPDNKDSVKKRRKEWLDFIETEYMENLDSSCLKKYSWRTRLFMDITKAHLFYITWLIYTVRNRKGNENLLNEIYE